MTVQLVRLADVAVDVSQATTNGVLNVNGAGGGAGGPVTLIDGADATQGAKADAPVTNPSLSASEIALLKGLLTVLAASLPLPTGASTAAKQPTLGTAGAASTDVLSVQGVASGTPLGVTANAGTNLNTSLLALEAGGNLATLVARTAPLISGGMPVDVVNFPATQPISAAALPLPAGAALEAGNLATLVARTPALGVAAGAASSPVVLANDQSAVPVRGSTAEQTGLSAGVLNADLVASTDVTAYRTWSLELTANAFVGTLTMQGSNDGTLWFSIPAFNSVGTTSAALTTLTSNNVLIFGPVFFHLLRIRMTAYTSGAAQGTLDLFAHSTPQQSMGVSAVQNGVWNTSPISNTTGGATPFHLVSAGSTNATSVKASAGNVYGGQVTNTALYAVFLKLYNKASSPTVGTDAPVKVIGCPAAAASSAGYAQFTLPVGVAFAAGIALAITKGIADADTTAVLAADCSVELDYK